MTAITLITDALFELGYIAVGAVPTAPHADRALRALNRMWAAWTLDPSALLVEARSTFTWTVSQATRTIGPTGNLVGQRPVQEPRLAVIPVGSTFETPLHPLTRAEYDALLDKTLTATYPSDFRYEPTAVNGTITVYPVPTTAPTLVVYGWVTLTTFADLNTDYDLAPGYERAIHWNLMKELGPGCGVAVSADLEDRARTSLGDIRRGNDQGPPPLRTDPLAGRGGPWLIETGRRS